MAGVACPTPAAFPQRKELTYVDKPAANFQRGNNLLATTRELAYSRYVANSESEGGKVLPASTWSVGPAESQGRPIRFVSDATRLGKSAIAAATRSGMSI